MSVPVWKRNRSKIQYLYDGLIVVKEIDKLMLNFLNKLNRNFKNIKQITNITLKNTYSKPIDCSHEAYYLLNIVNSIKIETIDNIKKKINILKEVNNKYKNLILSLSILQNNFQKYIKFKSLARLITIIDSLYSQIQNLINFNKNKIKNVYNK